MQQYLPGLERADLELLIAIRQHGSLAGAADRVRKDLACVVNRYNDPSELDLRLTDGQRVNLVEYLKSL